MRAGEIMTAAGDITLNEGREAVTLMVANTGDRPVQVGAHYHFFEANPALDFDREAARGRRLDIAAGTAVRFEPGQRREVRLIEVAGARRIYGFAGRIMGPLAVALALLLTSPAEAQKADCTAPQTQTDMNICAAREYAAADDRLNAIWPLARQNAESYGTFDLLLASQRIWIEYRDAVCAAEAALYEGGSMAPMILSTCLATVTDARAAYLDYYGQ